MSRPDDLQPADAHAPFFTIAPDKFGGAPFWAALERLAAEHHDRQRYLVADGEHLHRYRWSCGPCVAVLAVVDVLAVGAGWWEQQ